MRYQYVKNSNHDKGLTAWLAVEGNSSREARIVLLTGEPGTGKSRFVDHVGSEKNAVHIEGMPSMTVSYLTDLLAYELSVKGGRKFDQQMAIQKAISTHKKPIVLDEAQHGLKDHAACIEYLRRIAEQAGSALILVCHTSERHRFSEAKLAHIATRTSAVVEFKPADVDDTAQYLRELCEVEVDAEIVKTVQEQSRGRYRLMSNAISLLEGIASAAGKTQLTADDVKGIQLCVDAMASLNVNRKRGA